MTISGRLAEEKSEVLLSECLVTVDGDSLFEREGECKGWEDRDGNMIESHGRWAALSRQERTEILSGASDEVLSVIVEEPLFPLPSRLRHLRSRGPHYSTSVRPLNTDCSRPSTAPVKEVSKGAKIAHPLSARMLPAILKGAMVSYVEGGGQQGPVDTPVTAASPKPSRVSSPLGSEESTTSRLRARLDDARRIDKFYDDGESMRHLLT
ncbi:hypothetical protein FOZ63_002624 [Perkinsus olseni]|uniref:Uncharacterized protein n=1 Tax=Perkinsus olseni TaxID=32597 RepID=A0A7J6UJW9_PEROL|nr:hypothetical protein FOZ62_001399 [Perkinsus olseni]KAF4757336.1 hypothetical protein FOZ63_002624 [Perkinsus olseni]